MQHIERDGSSRRVEDRRLVHVVPKAVQAHPHKWPVERAPPGASFSASEFGKDTLPRPDGAHIHRAIGAMEEVIARLAAFIGCVSLPGGVGYMEVRDGHNMKVHIVKR